MFVCAKLHIFVHKRLKRKKVVGSDSIKSKISVLIENLASIKMKYR